MKQPLEKTIYSTAIKAPIFIGGLFILICPACYKFALGIVLGGLMGALTFRILTLDVYRLTSNPTSNVKKQATRDYFKRLGMYAVALVVGIVNPYTSFAATLIGLLLPKFITVIFVLLQRRD